MTDSDKLHEDAQASLAERDNGGTPTPRSELKRTDSIEDARLTVMLAIDGNIPNARAEAHSIVDTLIAAVRAQSLADVQALVEAAGEIVTGWNVVHRTTQGDINHLIAALAPFKEQQP